MTAWTTITAGLVAVGAKPFATTIQALRDNPIALAEGATGAPRIYIGALQRLTAGTEVRVRRDAAPGATSGTALNFGLLQSGTIRVVYERREAATDHVFALVRGSGGTTIASGAVPAGVQQYDVAVLPGDRIVLSWSGANSAKGLINCRMMTNGEDYFPVQVEAGVPEGNTYT